MATTPELQTAIQNLQGQAARFQAMLDARMAGSNDGPTLQRTARRTHTDQTPNDAAHADVWATWNAEETAHPDDSAGLWTMPEHAFWLRAAKTAILAGVIEPVPAPVTPPA